MNDRKNIRKEKSLAANVAYNMLSQFVALVVPLVTAPYIARVFNADLIGSYSYALANSSYFVLFECLGFPLYGQIKVAACRDDKEKVSKLFAEIMLAKLALTMVSLVIYMFIIGVPNESIQYKLCLVMAINILANGLDVTWFLNGFEEFKIIAIRSIVVRIVNIVGILFFIKREEQILLYAIIMQGATFASYLAGYPIVRKHISKIQWKKINVLQHVKPAGIYFVPGLVNTIFSSTDKTMLGIFSNNYEVGIYEQANKLSNICMTAISAIGNVILPRASYLYNKQDYKEKANELVYKSFNIVLMISIPVTLGMHAIAEEFIPIFFGTGYDGSIGILELLCYNVLFTSAANLLGQQCLVARQKQKEYNISIIVSAAMNVILNYLLIVYVKSVGAAIASVLASIASFWMIVCFSKKEILIRKLFAMTWKYLGAAVVMYLLIKIQSNIYYGTFGGIGLRVMSGGTVYFIILACLKEEFTWGVIRNLLKKRNDE